VFRRRSARSFVVELIAVVAAVAIVATVAYVYERHKHPPPKNERAIGGPQIALAHAPYAQIEPAAAVDPRDPNSFFAMSVDRREGTRLYDSHDGGRTWTTRVGPPMVRSVCGREDPSLAFVGDRLLAAFISSASCTPLRPEVTVAARGGAHWSLRIPFRAGGSASLPPFDSSPFLAVDAAKERVYLVWLRLVQRFGKTEIVNAPRVLMSRSDDGGRTWRKPTRIAAAVQTPYAAATTVGPHGDLYVAIGDADAQRLVIVRSTDGGASFGSAQTVAPLHDAYQPGCGRGGFVPRAQPQRCVGASPNLVTLSNGDVVVVYADLEQDGTEAIYSARFARDLRPLRRTRLVGPPDEGRADQFQPVAAYDRSTSTLWACYYDTHGDHERTHAWFTCTRSRDAGATWAEPVRAAEKPTDATRPATDPEGYGNAQALVVAAGRAHPFWTDRREPLVNEDIFTTILRAQR
jgi:hypothetical protein